MASTNKLPPVRTGEAWLLFEDLVCDGSSLSSAVGRTDSGDDGADNA